MTLIATYLLVASYILHGYKLLLSVLLFDKFIQARPSDGSREAFAPPNPIDQSSQVRRNLYQVRVSDDIFDSLALTLAAKMLMYLSGDL